MRRGGRLHRARKWIQGTGFLILVVALLCGCSKMASSDAYISLPETEPEADITIET